MQHYQQLLLLLPLLPCLQVTMLTATGAVLELSVPTAVGPGGRDFGCEQLAALARTAMNSNPRGSSMSVCMA
jgi:hypothetical protein